MIKSSPKIFQRTGLLLFLICAFAFIFRIVFLPLIQNPGLHDPIHYYNLGKNFVDGQGFTIDYVWHYNILHAEITHPIDHWMPFSGVLVAGGMKIFGTTPQASVLPFMLLGSLIPLVVYAYSRQLQLTRLVSLGMAGFSAVLPEFVINSLRPDTTIPNALFISGAIVLMVAGLQKETRSIRFLVASGILGGLAYLTRNDSLVLIPLVIVFGLAIRFWRTSTWKSNAKYLWVIPISMVITILPWLIRNWQVLGVLGSPETSKMFFFADNLDHYAYQRTINLDTLLESQSLSQLIGKRLFELIAAFKLMITTLDSFLPVGVLGGFLLLFIPYFSKRRFNNNQPQRQQSDLSLIMKIMPILIFILGILVAYPILIPFKSQAGSFKKAYITIIPLLIPMAGYALERVTTDKKIQMGLIGLVIFLMMANSYDRVRLDTNFANEYYVFINQVKETAQALPDTNGDGEIRLMSQDPYALSYVGMSSVMTPFESREKVLEVAQRYKIDYLLSPSGRPALDDLYFQQDVDARFELATSFLYGVRIYELYAIEIVDGNE